MTFCGVSKLVEAFKHKQVSTQAYKIHSWQVFKASILLSAQLIHTGFLPSSSFMLDMFCSFLERLGEIWEVFQISVKSPPAMTNTLPYAVRNSRPFLDTFCSELFFLLPFKHSACTHTSQILTHYLSIPRRLTRATWRSAVDILQGIYNMQIIISSDRDVHF